MRQRVLEMTSIITKAQLPISYRGEMVRAILDGRKTMTRRVIKDYKITRLSSRHEFATSGQHHLSEKETPGYAYVELESGALVGLPCPYGKPGDLLWVRERMRVIEIMDHGSCVIAIRVRYEADGAESNFISYPDRLDGTPVVGKCLAYGGYREASRITLENTDVRIERVQEISDADVRAEGVHERDIAAWKNWLHKNDCHGQAFSKLWDSINAKRGYGWDKNPWVWVIEFKRLTP
jgi:hypothetical protein